MAKITLIAIVLFWLRIDVCSRVLNINSPLKLPATFSPSHSALGNKTVGPPRPNIILRVCDIYKRRDEATTAARGRCGAAALRDDYTEGSP